MEKTEITETEGIDSTVDISAEVDPPNIPMCSEVIN